MISLTFCPKQDNLLGLSSLQGKDKEQLLFRIYTKLGLFGLSYATYRVIRNETLIEKDIWRFLLIVFYLERTNQLNLLPDKDLVDLCHPIEPY
jgi:hypothetical protein